MYDKEWDKRIKSGIMRGDHDCFRSLYRRFYSRLCQIACNYTGRPEIAEEIVQDTFLKLWEDRRDINIQGGFHSYLFIAVRNKSLNYLKHLITERRYSSEKLQHIHTSINYLHVSQEDGSSILISEEMERSFKEALESLPPKCREIFLLRRQEGLKHSEIAAELSLSQNTVQRQISIAIEKLTSKLLPVIREKIRKS